MANYYLNRIEKRYKFQQERGFNKLFLTLESRVSLSFTAIIIFARIVRKLPNIRDLLPSNLKTYSLNLNNSDSIRKLRF